jgi:signal transduction histidine kinase
MLTSIRQSLRAKVIAVVLIATGAALIVATLALLAYEFVNYQNYLLSDAETQADILARASAPALAFDDPAAAAANLALLETRPNFIAGAIYTANNQLFATYRRDGASVQFPSSLSAAEPAFSGGALELFRPITENDALLGTVYLRASYNLVDRLWDYLLILVVVMIVSLMAAGFLSLLLANSVTDPILSLTRIARDVIARRDFALRADKTTEDETGVLVEAFNAMMTEVDDHARALESSNDLLRRETADRRSAEAALRTADRRKDEFLATLAHELRNPLAPLVNALELLGAPNVDAQLAQQTHSIFARQLAQLVRLVDDLLDVSRITSGKLVIRKNTLELRAIVENVLETVRPLVDSRVLNLSIDLPEEPVYLFADSVRLSQVFSNLLNNSIKYSQSGGRITLSATLTDNTLRIRVDDEGMGISAEALPTVFEMFSQGENSDDYLQSGLGVGLALAKRLIELHDGTITAASPGRGFGSTFTIELPVTDAPAPDRKPPDGLENSRRLHRILVVDDNVDYAVSLGMLLQQIGHSVRVAHEANTALKIAREFQPEIGLFDLGLPGISGHSLARQLQESPETRNTVLVAVSGWGQTEDRKRSKEAGFALHLVKPVDLEAIQSAIQSLYPGGGS